MEWSRMDGQQWCYNDGSMEYDEVYDGVGQCGVWSHNDEYFGGGDTYYDENYGYGQGVEMCYDGGYLEERHPYPQQSSSSYPNTYNSTWSHQNTYYWEEQNTNPPYYNKPPYQQTNNFTFFPNTQFPQPTLAPSHESDSELRNMLVKLMDKIDNLEKNTQATIESQQASIQRLEKQMGQLAQQVSDWEKEELPNTSMHDPKDNACTVTLKSGEKLEENVKWKEVDAIREMEEDLEAQIDEQTRRITHILQESYNSHPVDYSKDKEFHKFLEIFKEHEDSLSSNNQCIIRNVCISNSLYDCLVVKTKFNVGLEFQKHIVHKSNSPTLNLFENEFKGPRTYPITYAFTPLNSCKVQGGLSLKKRKCVFDPIVEKCCYVENGTKNYLKGDNLNQRRALFNPP